MFVLPPPPPRYTFPVGYPPGTIPNPNMPVVFGDTSNSINHPEEGCPLQVGEGTYELRDDLKLAIPPPHPSDQPLTNTNTLNLPAGPKPPTSGVKLSLINVNNVKRNHPFSSKENVTAPVFGDGNPALTTPASKDKDGLKRRKPKNNIIKSSSSFVSRVIPHESMAKRLSERNPDGLFAFANVNRAFQWLDLSSDKKDEFLAKILFTKAHMLCHDVNGVTNSPTHLDVVMGSSFGDIIWFEPISQRYSRINKNGCVNPSPVSYIKWIPGSENLFIAGHTNGQLVVYDKEKDDAPLTADPGNLSQDALKHPGQQQPVQIIKSVTSRNQKNNPVAVWRLSSQTISQFAFSPDRRHMAVVLEDGSLRVMDYLKEEILDIFRGYYGGLICVCWSPDGKYIVTGGQDDLVTIWSFPERKVIARCQGHNSWVSYVAFDPWRCDERTYRFGSVGDDCRLLLWDFNVGMLHRPKAQNSQANARNRTSVIAPSLQHFSRHRADSTGNHVRSDSQLTAGSYDSIDQPVQHPVEPRVRTGLLPPIMSKVVGEDPVCWISFQEDCIMTSDIEGHVLTWDRPREPVNENAHVHSSSPAVSASATGSGSGSGRGDSGMSWI